MTERMAWQLEVYHGVKECWVLNCDTLGETVTLIIRWRGSEYRAVFVNEYIKSFGGIKNA